MSPVDSGGLGLRSARRRRVEDADRTGIGYELFAGHSWTLPWLERAIQLRPGLRFQQFFARGSEASYFRLEPRVGTRIELPFRLFANTDLSYAYKPYVGSSSLPEPGASQSGQQFQPVGTRRYDSIWRIGAGLERTFFDRVVAEARYSFLDNGSSHTVSDYERNLFGIYLTVQLGE